MIDIVLAGRQPASGHFDPRRYRSTGNVLQEILIDTDIDRATVELAAMAQRFMRVESFAHVKGRADKRHSMAVTVGISGSPATVQDEFNVTSLESPDVATLVSKIEGTLQIAGEERRNVILAALAELSARYLGSMEDKVPPDPTSLETKVGNNGR